jgi:nucleoside-diphosphate-sugar epimerase
LASNQENPVFSYNNNICGTIQLLEISRIIGVKHFIFASTSAIYENNNEFPLKESLITSPNLLYSLGKKQCEEIIQSYNEIYGLSYSILRFFNVYGPNQDVHRKNPALVPYVIDCYKNNKIPILHSDGSQKRDYVFIDDIISLFKILLIREPINDIINISSGNVISVVEIVDIIKSFFHHSIIEPIYRDPVLLWEKSDSLWKGVYPFSKDRMKREVEKYTLGDTNKSEELFDWKIVVDMKEGIKKCI